MKKKRKRKKKEIQLCSGTSSAVASAPNRKLFIQKNKNLTKPVKHQENTQKRLLVLGFFYWLVWFIFLGWVGFGFEIPTANPDVTLPSLIATIQLAARQMLLYKHFYSRPDS